MVETLSGGPNEAFPETTWSRLLRLQDPSDPQYRDSLEALASRYWKPVYAYIRRAWGKSIEDSKDLTQAFFLRFLDPRSVAGIQEGRGRFRNFVKAALKHFLMDEKDKAQAKKRGGEKPIVSLDTMTEDEDRRLTVEAPGLSAEEYFDRKWAHLLLTSCIQELKGKYRADGKENYFEAFSLFYFEMQGVTQQEVAKRLGLKESDVNNYLFHARRRLQEILLERIMEYVDSPEEAELELKQILALTFGAASNSASA